MNGRYEDMRSTDIVIVGTGDVANIIHMPVWKKIKEANVVGVYDINKERAEKVARNWKIPRAHTDFTELLENEEGAIIDICTPPSTHAALSVEAMKTGHSVILEKPMAMSWEECKKIMDEYQKMKGKVRLCIVHNFLFEPPLLDIKSIITKKQLDILNVDLRMLHTPNDYMISDRTHWVHSLPGGRFGENLIHPIYILRNLMGKLNVRDVYAPKMGSYDWVNYDELYATFDSDGRFGTVHISFNSPRWTTPLSVRVYGKELIINYDGSNLALTTQGPLLQGYLPKQKTSWLKLKVGWDNLQSAMQIMKTTAKTAIRATSGKSVSGHEYLFSSFIRSILENKEMPYTPEEAYESTISFLEVLQRLGTNGTRAQSSKHENSPVHP